MLLKECILVLGLQVVMNRHSVANEHLPKVPRTPYTDTCESFHVLLNPP